MIVIGLGTGRSGTASLARLLSAQKDALCFHEMNPSAVRFFGTPRPFINAIDEFQAILDGGDRSMLTVDLSRKVAARAYDALCQMSRVRLIGDIAFYYLSYVEAIAHHNQNVCFLCLRRNREETIRSWMVKSMIERWPSKRFADRLSSVITREHYHESHNFWMEHDGTAWETDPVWDKCFPKFEARSKRDAIAMYWDYYYERAEQLRSSHRSVFHIVDTERLSDATFQDELLGYCGVPEEDRVLLDVHIHRSAA